MSITFLWVTWALWLIGYTGTIIVCLIGKKKNPNKGWNLIILGEVIYIISHVPAMYFKVNCEDILMIRNYYFICYAMAFLGMVLCLVGLYRIAVNKN